MADLGRIRGPLVIPTGIEVDLVWNLASGKQVRNILHGIVAGGFSATTAIAQAVYASIIASGSWTAWAALLHSTCSFQGVNLRDIRTANMPLVSSTGASTPGTGAGVALPPGVALVITERTLFAGRGNRGRVYLPGLDSTALTAATGAATGAANTAATNFMNQVSTSLTASGITLALANPARQQYTGPKSQTLHLARSAAMVAVTSMVARQTALTSQRRRSYVA